MPRLWLLTCLGLIIALSVVSIFVGVIALSPLDLFQDPEALQLLAVSRLPRTAAAVLTGCSMAVSGQIMQVLVRNKFVEPISAGTGQAAALGILLSVLLFPAAGLEIKMSLAAATALLGTMGFLALVQRLPPDRAPVGATGWVGLWRYSGGRDGVYRLSGGFASIC